MKTLLPVAIVMLLACAGCSSSDDETTTPAGTPDASAGDSQGSETGSEAQSEAGEQDSGQPDSAESGTCENFSGAYTMVGSCNNAGYSMPSLVCVHQSNCSATVSTNGGQVFTGTVSGSDFEVKTSSPVAETCDGTEGDAAGLQMTCSGDTVPITCTGTGTKADIPDVTGVCCDVDAQDCGSNARCTVVGSSNGGGPYVTACVAKGTLQGGDTCTRTAVGRDNCGDGMICGSYNAEPGSMNCAALCTDNDQCADNEGCVNMGSVPAAGACASTCEFFDDTCPTGKACTVVNSLTKGSTALSSFCFPRGTKGAGESCTYADDCIAGYRCDGATPTCKQMCDDTHPCSNAGECTMLPTLASGVDVGLCP